MNGVLIIDKPVGPTSHDIVAWARRVLGETRIGHTGTLDPAASGVLALVLGKATRLARFLTAGDKSYDAVVKLGSNTDTGDAQGRCVGPEFAGAMPDAAAVEAALTGFRGTFLQQPPAYSAKKIDGRRSYKLARAGSKHAADDGTAALASEPSPLPSPVAVTAHALELVSMDGDRLTLRVTCSAGFYVRSLARDLGERLGTGAHLAALRRTSSGSYSLADALPLDAVERDRAAALAAIVPLDRMLGDLAAVELTADGTRHARQGRLLGPADLARPLSRPEDETWMRLFGPDGALIGLARRAKGHASRASGLLHPSVVLI